MLNKFFIGVYVFIFFMYFGLVIFLYFFRWYLFLEKLGVESSGVGILENFLFWKVIIGLIYLFSFL